MKAGIFLPQIGAAATRDNVVYVAKESEKRGLDSLWVLERLLYPIRPRTPYPATSDGHLPEDYQRVFDPIDLLSFVAAHTSSISLGTSVIDMPFHNPVTLGRRLATLDVLSGGRLIAGLGIGWSKDEYLAWNWPIWTGLISSWVVRSLLSHPLMTTESGNRKDLSSLGVAAVYQSVRVQVGNPPLHKVNFTPSQRIA